MHTNISSVYIVIHDRLFVNVWWKEFAWNFIRFQKEKRNPRRLCRGFRFLISYMVGSSVFLFGEGENGDDTEYRHERREQEIPTHWHLCREQFGQ